MTNPDRTYEFTQDEIKVLSKVACRVMGNLVKDLPPSENYVEDSDSWMIELTPDEFGSLKSAVDYFDTL